MANVYDLSGQTAVITGGAQGIGLACAHRLAESGARTCLWDINVEKAQAAADRIDGARAVHCDVTDYASVTAACAETEAAFDHIDILVNSAGIAGPVTAIEEYDTEIWNQVIAVNLTGTYHTNKAVLPGMKARNYGRIVNIASIAGKEGNPKATHYAASKAGVIGFTKALGKEVAEHDIAVNCITPAVANTEILEQVTEEFIEFMLSKIPRGRFVEVEEIANMVAWMSSRECSFTTAAVFDISGGRATY